MNQITFLSHYKPLFEKKRYKVLLSGRGSGKSFHVALALLWLASRCRMRILCLREFMNSIGDSSKAQIEEVITLSGTESSWTITRTSITHKVTGSVFIFKGLRNNYNSLKSIPNIDIAVVEECAGMSQESLDALIPTIRKEGSEIWLLGNPQDRHDPVASMFIERYREDAIVIANDYRDNPFCSRTIIAEAEAMKTMSEALYNHIYIGEYLDTSTLILVDNVAMGDAKTISNPKVVVGVDIARDGGDRTVIAVRRGYGFASIRSYDTMDIDKLSHELQAVIARYKPERINIDSTGHGAWAGDALKAYGIDVRTINFASDSRKPERYGNMRTELYGLAKDYFAGGGVIPRDHADLDKELSASYYLLDKRNRPCLIPKAEIKKKIGRSPDIADAVCLSLLCDGDMYRSTKATDSIDDALLAKELATVSGW